MSLKNSPKTPQTTLSALALKQQASLIAASQGRESLVDDSSSDVVGGRFFEIRGLILLGFLALTLWLNLSFLKPLVMGAIFAVVLYPLMSKFSHLKLTNRFSATLRAALITLGFMLLILIPVGVLIFAGVQALVVKIQSLNLKDFSPDNLSFSSVVNDLGLHRVVENLYDIVPMSHEEFQNYATKGIAAAAAFGGSIVQDFIVSLPAIAFSSLVLLFTIFFLLIDGSRMVHFIRQNSIFNRQQTDRLIGATASLCNSVIVATIAVGAFQAVLVGLVGLFAGAGSIILIIFITFISSFLPIIGTAPVILFLAIQSFASGHATVGLIWLATIAVAGVSDNIIRPYVLKGGAELHPLVGFVAAFGALDVLGFYGLFIGPIVAGLFFTLLPMVTRTYPRTPRTLR